MNTLTKLPLLFLLATALPGQQPPTWIKSPVTGKHYAMSPTYNSYSWGGAKALAQKWGGTIASIPSKAENDWIIKTFVDSYPPPTSFIIGLTDEAKEGTWVWVNGAKVTYTNWMVAGSMPNPRPGQKYNYTFMIGRTGTGTYVGQWASRDWNTTYDPALIERFDATSTSFGTGCASTKTKPTITVTPPRFGQRATVEIKGFLPRAQLGVLALGLPRKNSIPVVIGIGWPCSLLIPIDITSMIQITAQGSFKADLLVPNTPSLAGTPVYLQAWAPDPANGRVGIALTNAAIATLGH